MIDRPEMPDIETSSEAYASRFTGQIGSWFLRIQEEATLRMLKPYTGAKVLDVGGGHGQIAEALVLHGFQVTVIGSTDGCKTRLKNLLQSNRCAFKVGNILRLPYHDQAFDVVISYRLLSHVTEWETLLRELTRVARRAVILDYPSLRSLNYIAPYLFQVKKQLERNTRPFTCFRESDLSNMLRTVGFAATERYPEFCFPMVLHRTLKAPKISSALEKVCRLARLTDFFGSPVILKATRVTN
jgi:ubiquinone/menaquinone biosynthesis C-methylase UbiE